MNEENPSMKVKREQKIKREFVPCFPQTLIITFQLCKCKYTHTYTFIYLPIYVCTLAECYLAYLHACIFATYAHYNSSRTLTNSIKSHGNTHANSTYTHTHGQSIYTNTFVSWKQTNSHVDWKLPIIDANFNLIIIANSQSLCQKCCLPSPFPLTTTVT